MYIKSGSCCYLLINWDSESVWALLQAAIGKGLAEEIDHPEEYHCHWEIRRVKE